MSNIGDYQALLAAAAVTFTNQNGDAESITAKDATALKNVALASACPLRLLLPYGGLENTSAEAGEPYIGNQQNVVWTFGDWLLWRPVSQGRGLADSAYDLREYASAYMTMALALDFSSISDLMVYQNIILNLYPAIEFPDGSGDFFIGAIATWTVLESDPL